MQEDNEKEFWIRWLNVGVFTPGCILFPEVYWNIIVPDEIAGTLSAVWWSRRS